MTDILSTLKSETAAWHARVEASVAVMDAAFSRADYVRLLERFYGWYAPLETELAGAQRMEQLLPDWQVRLKLPALTADLCWLGLTNEKLRELPSCLRLPPLDTAEGIFGLLYVTEGATLGGQIISRHLNRTLHVQPGAGCTFFGGHGPATGAMWSAFRAALQQMAADADQRQIVESAQQTFELMWRWLNRE